MIECWTKILGIVVAVLGKADAWFVMPCVGRADYCMICIVSVTFGQADVFVLVKGDAVVY